MNNDDHTTTAPSARIVRLGQVPYDQALARQMALRDERIAARIGDHVLLVSHPHTLTVGTRGGKPDRWANLQTPKETLEARGVGLFEIDRGGDITYHGPGQLVVYPIIHLDRYRRDVGHYVSTLEQVALRTLEALGIGAQRRDGYPGVWIGDEKIAAIGARIKRWVTMHGMSLNVRGPLEGFDWIVPCGLDGKGITSIERQLPTGACPDDETILALVTDALRMSFDWIADGDDA